ncbi:5-formyltetrahydrofolate cyclo-ligase [Microstroma glucosiphilum]|uniref:5-formyltetrahydrofolate cyclo-ligase n=1 Tax=Pseudomicrostroma glucosiphilum TaxID=1684307 RepID=A0A316U4Q3_9BASI|nr:5-formyltetrahydrofolate cyclo-ligase [Pseudomicrostroma glucosiphilum]PWN20232.1 5-formyltetrahydrofolate cyclo-ligase [Pseudomicrostroma glucosiphilum]
MAATNAAAASAAGLRTAKRSMRKAMAQRLAQMSRQEILEQSEHVTRRILASPTYQRAEAISVYVSMASGEVDTDHLCRHTLLAGKRLYVPLFAAPASSAASSATSSSTSSLKSPASTFSSDMRMLRLRTLAEYEGMKMNRWGIREPEEEYAAGVEEISQGSPSPDQSQSQNERVRRENALDPSTGGSGLDLILSPGVAFDEQAGRLGHGKGYYDRYLARCEEFAQQRGKAGPVCVALGLTPQVLPSGERVPQDEYDRTLDGIVVPSGVLRATDDRGRWE